MCVCVFVINGHYQENWQQISQKTNKMSYRIECEAMDPVASGENNHGGAAVESITSGYLLRTRLKEISLTGWTLTDLGTKEGGRKGGREEGRKRGREEGSEGGREEAREREEGRKEAREREGGRKRGREREGGRKGGREVYKV